MTLPESRVLQNDADARPLDIVLLDAAALVESLVQLDFDEARFRCVAIILRAKTAHFSAIQSSGEHLACCLTAMNTGAPQSCALTLADLIAEISEAMASR